MGWTLSRYVLLRYWSITISFFIGLFALVFLIDFTELSRRLAGLPEFSLGAAAAVSLLRVPMLMQQTAPFIGLFSAMAMLISLNRKFELVVARAAGISAWQILVPACCGALLFGAVMVLLFNPLAAYGFNRSAEIEADLRSGGHQRPSSSSVVPWLRQRTADGDTIIGAQMVQQDGRKLVQAVFLSLDKDGNIAVRRDAFRAFLRDGFWDLRRVNVYASGKAPQTLRKDTVATDLKPAYVMDKLAPPESMSIYQLPLQIEIARSFGVRAEPFAMQFNSLIALPFLLTAMTLIAATVSMRYARMGQSATLIVGGVLAGFLLYVVSVLVRTFGNAGMVAPAVAAWVPVVVATFFGVTFLLYKEDG